MTAQSAMLVIAFVATVATFVGTLLAVVHFDAMESQDPEEDYEYLPVGHRQPPPVGHRQDQRRSDS